MQDRTLTPRVPDAPEPLPPDVLDPLVDVLGPDGVVTAPGSLLVYESDGLTAYRSRPRAVLLPRDTRQVPVTRSGGS